MRRNELIAVVQDRRQDAPSQREWRTVDRALRAIAVKRAGLDAEELSLLREAEALQIWRPLGMVSVLDYLERVFGYTPRVAEERLRVSRALTALPRLSDELAHGKLPFSAVRELTRVVAPETEAEWVAAAAGKTVREIEDMVSGRRPGDRPGDAPDPEARTHVVRFELSAGTFARLRQARQALDAEHGRRLSDDELIAALCEAGLESSSADEPMGRAKFQIAVTVCERCRQGWQEGAGVQVAVDAAAVERAGCDAQHVGSIDGAQPERAHQDIAPRVVRFVWRRDGGRCRVPGCRSARGLEIHHVVHRANGGGHEPSNLVLLCSSCHLAHHRDVLSISGTADQLVVRRPGDRRVGPDRGPHARAVSDPTGADRTTGGSRTAPPAGVRRTHVGARHSSRAAGGGTRYAPAVSDEAARETTTKLGAAILRVQGKQALVGMGWKPGIAEATVAAALDELGPAVPLERLIVEALRRCQRPSTVIRARG